MTYKNRLILTILLVAIGFIVISKKIITLPLKHSPSVSEASCPTRSLQEIKAKATEILKLKESYIASDREVSGLSTEGGVQTTYRDQYGKTKFIHQVFYGDTFRSELNYYIFDNVIFFVEVTRSEYAKPIGVDSNVKIVKRIVRDFSLDENQNVCAWYLDGAIQPLDQETKDFIKFILPIVKEHEGH